MLTRDFLDERLVPELEANTVQYFDHIRRYLFAQQYVGDQRVLDIACGTGYGSELLARGGAQYVISLDIALDALHYAGQHCHGNTLLYFGQADAIKLPLPSQSVDILTSFETIEHLPMPDLFLAEAKRVLVPGGKLIVSTPNRTISSPGHVTPFSPYHTFEPNLSEFLSLFESTGWQQHSLYGITHSARAQTLIQPPTAPFSKQPSRIAWASYIRSVVRNTMPPFVYTWLSQRRTIPELDIADSILGKADNDRSAYFVAVWTAGQPMQNISNYNNTKLSSPEGSSLPTSLKT